METKIFDWTKSINEDEIKEVKKVLDNNGVVIFPTDTVYGIASNGLDDVAINKLFEFKERNYNNPINLLTNSVDKVKDVARSINDIENNLIKKYMPGAFTIILKKKENISDLLTAKLDSVGIRIPDNEIALKILGTVDYPLATTSANISGKKDSIKVSDFIDEFKGKVDIIINGGETDLKISSTIVRVDDNEIKILRQGTIIVSE